MFDIVGNVVRPKHPEQIGTAMGESLVESLGKPGGGAPFARTAQPTLIEPQGWGMSTWLC